MREEKKRIDTEIQLKEKVIDKRVKADIHKEVVSAERKTLSKLVEKYNATRTVHEQLINESRRDIADWEKKLASAEKEE